MAMPDSDSSTFEILLLPFATFVPRMDKGQKSRELALENCRGSTNTESRVSRHVQGHRFRLNFKLPVSVLLSLLNFCLKFIALTCFLMTAVHAVHAVFMKSTYFQHLPFLSPAALCAYRQYQLIQNFHDI